MSEQAPADQAPARPRISSGAAFFDEDGRILLVNPTYKAWWNLPGGGVDAAETPRAACVREVREELGITPPIGRLLLTLWAEEGQDGRLFMVFDGGVLPEQYRKAIVLPADELSEHAFVTVEQARTMLPAERMPLLLELIEAKTTGELRYLEATTNGLSR